MIKHVSGEEGVKGIESSDHVLLGGAATPHFLLEKLVERHLGLWSVELIQYSPETGNF